MAAYGVDDLNAFLRDWLRRNGTIDPKDTAQLSNYHSSVQETGSPDDSLEKQTDLLIESMAGFVTEGNVGESHDANRSNDYSDLLLVGN